MSILINSPVVKGNGNSVVINRDSSSDIQWDRLEKECFQALQQLPSNCDENKAVKEVLADAIHCDEINLKATVKRYAAALSSGLFTREIPVGLIMNSIYRNQRKRMNIDEI